jgi:hypothetical protein
MPNLTVAYADALNVLARHLATLAGAPSALADPQLVELLAEVCAAGRRAGLARETVAEQVRSSVLFLRTDALGRADRLALAERAAAAAQRCFPADARGTLPGGW